MKTFDLKLYASDNPVYDGKCEYLSAHTSEGSIGILADHCNMAAALTPGILTYRVPGEDDKKLIVSQGILTVQKNEVSVLAATMERPEDIDENRARETLERTKAKLLQKQSREEYLSNRAKISREIARIRGKEMANM